MLSSAAAALVVLLSYSTPFPTQATGTLLIRVVGDDGPVEHAVVRVGPATADTPASGEVELTVAGGPAEIIVERFGFASRRVTVIVKPGAQTRVVVELEEEAVLTENVVVTATRSTRRIQDLPLRVEVIPQEEIDEKLSMTPGDVAMMLTETNGLRVQVTSPSTGAANVRVQGLRGRYTQILSDGLPLYGQAGSVSVLQIPPMDLGQVEVIKGVASALYGAAALGGVINLVSRRPVADRPERELLLNRTSRGGTDGALWLSRRLSPEWGYTFLGGAHFQTTQDVNGDGWADIPSYKRVTARPREFWENSAGKSVFLTVGAMFEDRAGRNDRSNRGSGRTPVAESLDTRRIDASIVARNRRGERRTCHLQVIGPADVAQAALRGQPRTDTHDTWYAEGALNGRTGRHNRVTGTAVQQDGYRNTDLPSFDNRYSSTALFAQDDYAPVPWLSASVNGRLDFHSDFGTFLSPRVSVLAKPIAGWSARLSLGTGFYVPSPFLEETEAAGLSRLAPLGDLDPERGRTCRWISAGNTSGWN